MATQNSLGLNLLRWWLRLCLMSHKQQEDGTRQRCDELIRSACLLSVFPYETQILKKILKVRQLLKAITSTISITDYETGTQGEVVKERRVSDIYSSSSVPHSWAMFLFRLVRAFKPVQILELGANLGVSSAYLRCAADINTNNAVLTTIENDSTLSTYAKKTLGTVSNQPSTVLTGSFVEVLPTILQGDIKFDFVLIKGYRYRVDETVKCFQMIEPFLNKNACVVFDDIYPRASSNRPAWRRIQIDRTEALFYDFWRYGVMIA